MTIFITSPGMPDEIKELRFDSPEHRRRPLRWRRRNDQ
jgi:hypothetical protein